MIGSGVGADDLRTFASDWGANHVRWQLIWGGFPNSRADTATMGQYDAWLETELKRLDDLLPLCQELGLRVLIDLHTPPGGRGAPDKSCAIFHRADCQKKFLEIWEKIAKRYRGAPAVWGYDLVNEPVEGNVAAGLMDWPALCREAAKRVRAIDAKRAIVVEPAPWGSPASLDHFEPLEGIDGIIYSVHMYLPMTFTHQGVYETPIGAVYPGIIDGRTWDQDRMRYALKPVTDFQRAYRVPIYIGEFSAIRWAPDNSAHRYLKDLIGVFEENGWDWAYHAFREWDGWSVEHGDKKDDRTRSATRTDRETLLREHFAKNRR
jgi:aryl-phospho-beta-D-glucosidase BglC (GH1 family)